MDHNLPISITNNFNNLQSLITLTRKLLNEKKDISKLFRKLHPANAASILQFLNNNEREEVISKLGDSFDPEILNFLDENIIENVIDLWAVHELAQKLEKLEGQDAIKILEELHVEERRALLRALNPEIRVFLEESLSYPEESAGRLMQYQVIAVPLEWDVQKTILFLSNAKNLPKDLHEIYIVNKQRKPIAKIDLATLIQQEKSCKLKDICSEIEVIFTANTPQKDVFFAFRQYSLNSLPIIDKKERLVGLINVTDIIDEMYLEAQEDFLHSGGLEESDFYDSLLNTSKARLKWLSFSIIGSVIVAVLIDFFQSTIKQKAELVSLIQVVMNISSVAAIQVVTVNIRAVLNRELNIINIKRTFLKELIVSLINGLILGSLLGLIFGVKYSDPKLGLILGISLLLSLLWGAINGTFLPIIFQKFKIDPTLSSGAFLGWTIDSFAAISFLLITKLAFNF